jgi:serine/threonine-protein kinase
MGIVFVGVREEGNFRRLYAIKRLHPHLSDDATFRTMFLDEARIAGLVQHPNVVGVLDVGENAEGLFMVMEYVNGVNLGGLIRASQRRAVDIPVQIVVRIAMQVARGLHAVHELEGHDGVKLCLVHRDLSPQNVLVGFDGSVRITDFGIAKALGRLTETGAGVLKGKLAYASPEQILCYSLDHRTDLFSLAVVIHELLTGRPLYRNEKDQEGTWRILHEAPPDVGEDRPDVPPRLVELLFCMLAKDREKRPASAEEVCQELEVVLSDLVREEGPLDVQSFVADIAAEERHNRDHLIDTAVAAIRDRARFDVTAHEAAVGRPTHEPATRRWSMGVAVVLTAALLAGAIGVAAMSVDRAAASRSGELRSTKPAASALAPALVPGTAAADEDPPSVPPPTLAEPAAAQDRAAPSTRRPRSREGRPRARADQPRAASSRRPSGTGRPASMATSPARGSGEASAAEAASDRFGRWGFDDR